MILQTAALKHHLEGFDALGVDAHSSDEEDSTAALDARVFIRHTLPWRASVVRDFFRNLDRIRLAKRASGATGAKRGPPPRRRIAAPPNNQTYISKRFAAQHLPENAYNSTWLAARNMYERDILIQPSPMKPDWFVIDPTFMK